MEKTVEVRSISTQTGLSDLSRSSDEDFEDAINPDVLQEPAAVNESSSDSSSCSDMMYSISTSSMRRNSTESLCSDTTTYHSSIGTATRSSLCRSLSLAITPERPRPIQDVPIYHIKAIVVATCAVLIAIGFIFLFNINTSTNSNNIFCSDINGIKEKYNINENSIQQIQAEVTTIYNKQDMGMLLFIYDSDKKNFNMKKFNEIINDIAVATARFLSNNSGSFFFTSIEGSQLDMEPNDILCRYGEVETTGVLLVRHLEAVPAGLALAFHYYWEEYNPVNKNTAIFLTLNLATCPVEPDGKKSSRRSIEECLAQKWSKVPADNIAPVLARALNVVIDLSSAF